MMAIGRVNRQERASLTSSQVFVELRQAIVSLELEPGQKLSENEIALRFGVSRTPVREAFIKLAEAGLLEVQPQRGTFVVPISIAAVKDARFVREAVEIAVVREACDKADPVLLARLERNLADQRQTAAAGDYQAFIALDQDFHRTLALGIGRDRAWAIVEAEKAQMDRACFLSLPNCTPVATLIAQHEAVVAAIAARDREAAEAAMRSHLTELLVALDPLQARYPGFFATP